METGSGRNLESNARSSKFGECRYQGKLKKTEEKQITKKYGDPKLAGGVEA